MVPLTIFPDSETPVIATAPTSGVLLVLAIARSGFSPQRQASVKIPVAAGRTVSVFGEAIENCAVESAA